MPRVAHRVLSQNSGGCQYEAVSCAVLYLATTVLCAVRCAVPRHLVCCAVPAAHVPRHPGGRGGRVRHYCTVVLAMLPLCSSY